VALRFLVNHGPARTVFEAAVERDLERARLSTVYRAYYGLARPLIPIRVRQWLQGRVTQDPRGLYPDDFMRRLEDALGGGALDIVHPWPGGAEFGFVLTHDVESAEGLEGCAELAGIEEDLGFRSVFNVVPYGYPIDRGIVEDLAGRGFEIGIHGYNHDGRLFSSSRTFRRRLPAMQSAMREYGAIGFRAPMVHRNLELLQELQTEYDTSFFDADPFQAMPGGVGSIWPFMAGDMVELPYTLPQDHTLFVVLGEVDGLIWRQKLSYVAERAGMALMLTHPEYLAPRGRLHVYREFLESVRERSGYWHALPKECARWWRVREASSVEVGTNGTLSVVGPAASQGGVPARLGVREGGLRLESIQPSIPRARVEDG
jgi:peptidoglycan/xylan/chitin deacetylase (PgdA/CDA1 family)